MPQAHTASYCASRVCHAVAVSRSSVLAYMRFSASCPGVWSRQPAPGGYEAQLPNYEQLLRPRARSPRSPTGTTGARVSGTPAPSFLLGPAGIGSAAAGGRPALTVVLA